MKKTKTNSKKKYDQDDSMGCLGEFNPNNEVCSKYCALNVQCIIKQDEITRTEILEDLFYADESMNITLQ